MSTSKLVYSTKTGQPSPVDHPRIVERIHAARVRKWVKCATCGYDKHMGAHCGQPCL